MGLVCRKIVRNTFCSIPFVLGLTAGVFVYLHNSLGRDNKGGRLRGGHATLSQESSLLDKLETNINLLKDLPTTNYVRPRFIRDEINITDHLFFAIVDRSTNAPKNFLKYHNLTTSQLTKKFVVFQQQMPNNRVAKESSNNAAAVAAASPPYSVTLEDLSLATILRHIIDNYSNYIFYYIIDSSALVNGVELSELIEKLYFKSDFLIGHPIQTTSRQNHHGCDLTKGFLVHHHLLEVISNQSAAIDCVSEVGGGINYIAATTATYTEAAVPSSAAAVARPVVIYGLTSELEYQAATETILKDQEAKLSSRLETIDEEIELFIDESDYLEVEWPEVVYKPRLDLDRFDNDVYDHIDMNGQIVDNNPKQTTNKQELEALDELKSECNTRYDSTFSNAWRKVNFHNGINVLNNFISSGQDDKAVISECSIHQEVSEPILVSLPFVTESTKISMVVPVAEQDKLAATNFLKNFAKMCLERNDRVFLMLVFLYTRAHPEKNNNQDFFKEVKQTALQYTKKYKKKDKGSSILWYSLQTKDSTPVQVQAMDLLIQKLDSTSIILLGSPYMELHNDYLNRVRMNTVEGRLVFSPIPYTDYNQQVLGNGYTSLNQGFNTSSGHFDEWNYEHISFYKSDFLALRQNLKSPVILKESDLVSQAEMRNLPTEIFRLDSLFQEFGHLRRFAGEGSEDASVDFTSGESAKQAGLHVLRAPDPSLRLRYRTVKCESSVPPEILQDCKSQQLHSLGSRNLLANIFLKNIVK